MSAQTEMTPYQFLALTNPYTHFAMIGGVAIGKTFTGAHFSIQNFERYPDLTGFIGANNYDQMSQATLAELFYWLDYYGFEFVIDRMPPEEWGCKRVFKKYTNILSVRNPLTKKVSYAYTRILAKANPLRGLEFSWYWIDESRDTPQNTHDVLLSRLREGDYVKGLVTTTPNAEDWVVTRFMRNADGRSFGSMHVKTVESVRYGIITQKYYDDLRRAYDPLMAMQELDAEHVNTSGGRAYYAFGDGNKQHRCPWTGLSTPDPNEPLIVGCDFNFQPAPCVWIVGQMDPDGYRIHWFHEIAMKEVSTPTMVRQLTQQFPGFFYRIFGDASGNRGTTSNAGEHDYAQIGITLDDLGYSYSIDVNPNNPLVKDRVENMNALAQNAMGEIRMTYNPSTCPLFDADTRTVGWKKMVGFTVRQRLDDMGDHMRTHATDGAGYAAFKLLPPSRRGYVGHGIAMGRVEAGIPLDRPQRSW